MGLIRATFSSSPILQDLNYVRLADCTIASCIALLIEKCGARYLAEKTGIPARNLHRYAKGAAINKHNSRRLEKLPEIAREWKQQSGQIAGGTAVSQCTATDNE